MVTRHVRGSTPHLLQDAFSKLSSLLVIYKADSAVGSFVPEIAEHSWLLQPPVFETRPDLVVEDLCGTGGDTTIQLCTRQRRPDGVHVCVRVANVDAPL